MRNKRVIKAKKKTAIPRLSAILELELVPKLFSIAPLIFSDTGKGRKRYKPGSEGIRKISSVFFLYFTHSMPRYKWLTCGSDNYIQ